MREPNSKHSASSKTLESKRPGQTTWTSFSWLKTQCHGSSCSKLSGLIIVSVWSSQLSRFACQGGGRGGTFSVRQHNLSSSAGTKEYSHFVTSLCSSPSFKREEHGTVWAIHTMRQRGARGTEGPTGKSGRLDSDLALATLELTAWTLHK